MLDPALYLINEIGNNLKYSVNKIEDIIRLNKLPLFARDKLYSITKEYTGKFTVTTGKEVQALQIKDKRFIIRSLEIFVENDTTGSYTAAYCGYAFKRNYLPRAGTVFVSMFILGLTDPNTAQYLSVYDVTYGNYRIVLDENNGVNYSIYDKEFTLWLTNLYDTVSHDINYKLKIIELD